MKLYIFILVFVIVSCSEKQLQKFQNEVFTHPIVNDIDSAFFLAHKQSKEILLLFNCYNCNGSRQNNLFFLTEPEIKNKIARDYIFLILYVDDQTKLIVENSESLITIGQLNKEFQQSILKMSPVPSLLLIDTEKSLLKVPLYSPFDRESILNFLNN